MLAQYDPNVRAVITYLQLLGVKVTNFTVDNTLQNHRDWPSLLCVSDSLSKWHVPNAAGRIDKDEINQLPVPFLAAVLDNVSPFAVVKEVTETKVGYFPQGYKRYKVETKEDFFKIWSGVYLIAEPNERSGEKHKEYTKIMKKGYIRSFIQGSVSLLLLFALFYLLRIRIDTVTSLPILGIYLQFLVLLGGIVVAILLLWYEVDDNNPLLQRVCTGLAKTNCHAVLSSRGAKVFSWLSWSEVGFIYFSGELLMLLFSAGSLTTTMALLGWLSILALPYPVFSLWYQWKVAKQWCVLCLCVQLLLVIAALNTISNGLLYIKFDHPFELLIGTVVSFLLPALIWMLSKPVLFGMQKAKKMHRDYLRIKYNEEMFDILLKKQTHLRIPVDDLGIDLGNTDASNVLIKVCNPYCGPCSKAHQQIEDLLEQHNNLRVKIIFTARNDNNDIGAFPARHLMALASKGDEKITKLALDDWYLSAVKNYSLFADKYPLNGELEKQGPKLEAMFSWCKEMNVIGTPTFFFNGHLLPNAFGIDELNYFLWE
ncbi:MAG: hypothetical protein BGO55_11655 [Sphingobacteriales bacterium 50-39]|nr:thioredoxin domain-containing protein [Sphingobacteriales bacterium]OJW54345.1 MAG: hypothetical protein BGO55_11655 [Sphingobacteriales bacterium 50-39]